MRNLDSLSSSDYALRPALCCFPSAMSILPPTRSYRAIPRIAYQLHVFSSRNNTILTLTTTGTSAQGIVSNTSSPVAWVSAGSAGYKGAARGTFDAAVEVSLRMFKKVADLVNPPILSGGQKLKTTFPRPDELEIIWKGFGQGRDAVFRTLMSGEGDAIKGLVNRVTDAVSNLPSLSETDSSRIETSRLFDTFTNRRQSRSEGLDRKRREGTHPHIV